MVTAAVFLPLLGFLIVGLFGRLMGDRLSQFIACGLMGISAILSIAIFNDVALNGNARVVEVFDWVVSGSFSAAWALRVDTLSAVMLLVVNVVSFLVHVYSVGYMHHDPGVPRFMAYMSLFTFAMLMLVTADNLLQLFFGWEGVGLASYLLIGFWHERASASAAAIKAFLVNRVGDFGFALGIFACYVVFDSIEFSVIFAAAESMADARVDLFGCGVHAMTLICMLLFVGAMGKSAQIGLHTWLPDAMEGPTPVSALIHAATMVTAGVFLVARMSPLFEYSDTALMFVTAVGAVTAFFAATIGCVQNDIKRVIAYSTCSQLGYMFFALGVGAYSAAIFHLMTHAFFKALLFLGAGSVIHAMSDEQDMRRMGGIWKHIKITYAMMWIGSLALAGLPLFAGYYSKDIVLEAAYGAHTRVGEIAFWLGIAAALMTAFYSWRLLFMTFHGAPRGDEKTMAHIHESPPVMTIPLAALALGAIFAGMLGYEQFVGESRGVFWGDSLAVIGEDPIEAAHHVPGWVPVLPAIVAVFGIITAWVFYILRPGIPAAIGARFPAVHAFLVNKWYFDEFYDWAFVRPAQRLGHGLWKEGDGAVIDGCGPDGVAALARSLSKRVSALQSGYVYHYVFAMILGVAAIVTLYVFGFIG